MTNLFLAKERVAKRQLAAPCNLRATWSVQSHTYGWFLRRIRLCSCIIFSTCISRHSSVPGFIYFLKGCNIAPSTQSSLFPDLHDTDPLFLRKQGNHLCDGNLFARTSTSLEPCFSLRHSNVSVSSRGSGQRPIKHVPLLIHLLLHLASYLHCCVLFLQCLRTNRVTRPWSD